MTLLDSIMTVSAWFCVTLLQWWLYSTLVDSTPHSHGSTWVYFSLLNFNLVLLDSVTALLDLTYLNSTYSTLTLPLLCLTLIPDSIMTLPVTLLDSLQLYHAWLCVTLLNCTMVLFHFVCPHHGSNVLTVFDSAMVLPNSTWSWLYLTLFNFTMALPDSTWVYFDPKTHTYNSMDTSNFAGFFFKLVPWLYLALLD